MAIGLAVLGSTPPRPQPVSAYADVFSAGRAMADVERIARAPHPSASPEFVALRGYLMRRLESMRVTVRTQESVFPQSVRPWFNRHNGTAAAEIPLVNVIGILPGRDPKLPAVALMAHYDSVPGSPAAADDGSGVAAILETVRALSLDYQRRRDVIVILTDGEEAGLVGAKLFFGQAPEVSRIGAIINLEARGGGGKANLFQTSPMNGDAVRAWAASVPHPAGTSLATFIYSVLPNDTDLSVLLRLKSSSDIPAWNFAFIGRPGLYHSPLATAERLDQGSLQQMGEQTLGLARALSRAEQLPGTAPGIVFFDVFGLFVVHYAVWCGWAMLALGFAGYAALAARRFEPLALLGGTVRMLGLVVVAGAALQGLNLISQGPGPVDYYDRLAAVPRLQWMALSVCIGAALLLTARRPSSRSGEAGFVLPLWVAGAAMQALAPTAAYVLTVPLALGGAAALLRLRHGVAGTAAMVVVAALVTGYALMLGYELMQAVGAMVPAVAVLPLALACTVLLPLRPVAEVWTARFLVGVFLLAAVVVALWVRWDAPADSIPIYSEARKLGGKD
ncbi:MULTISPECIES: M28 family peptidase [unclassified Novosphingobium]|uniref:M28 family peptidase n=1 Tax=unclassified Novosphingobium TaxID=2644732 RepID=UPI00135710C8|nr:MULTISPECIES: M28 family peptidase [unclassified Novosphingobium]